MNVSGLKPYQPAHALRLVTALRRNRAALDGSDMGTGKTFVACSVARELQATPLVICPLSVTASWKRAASAMGVEVEVVNYEKARGTRRKRLQLRDNICATNAKPFLGPFLNRMTISDWGEEFKAGAGSYWKWTQNFEFVIFDEVHRCGGSTSLNSKMLIAAKRQAKHVLALSATAADNPVQMKALGFALGLFELPKFHWWLMSNGCTPGIHGGYDFSADPLVQEDAMAGIGRQIYRAKGSRLRKADIHGFPQTLLGVKLIQDETAKAMPLIEDLKEAFVNGHGLAELMRIRQELELLRVPALCDLAEDATLTSKVLIFVNYMATVDAICGKLQTRLKIPIPIIDGRHHGKRRDEIVRAFQENYYPVMILNSQAGGTGLDLHDPTGKVERTSLISPCWNAKDMKQVLGRPQREGGGFSQQYFVYFADTLEEDIARDVQQKFGNLDALNDAAFYGIKP